MQELKNCPNCGGTINENGRCNYCDSKIYDVEDSKIEMSANRITFSCARIVPIEEETKVICEAISKAIEKTRR